MKIIYLFLLWSIPAQGANHYIRAGAGGSSNGSSWANAWPTFAAASWTRGDTNFVAGGTYTEDVTVGAAESGTSLLTLKRANASDNSSDSGWSSAYDSMVVIQGFVTVNNSYTTIEGVTNYGIKVVQSAGGSGNAIMNLADGKSFFTLAHFEMQGPGWGYSVGVSGFKQNSSVSVKGHYFHDLFFHDLSQNGFVFIDATGSSFVDYGLLFDHVILQDCGYNVAGQHGQGIQVGSGAGASSNSFWTIRNSKFRNIEGTAAIACLGFSTNADFLIYNNIFVNTNLSVDANGNWVNYTSLEDAFSPGMIYVSSTSASSSRIKVYNNTSFQIARNTIYFDDPVHNGNEVVNNLFLNGHFNIVHQGVTGTYDDYFGCETIISSGIFGVPYGETGQQGESSSPCVNAVNNDFRLVSAANAVGHGTNLSGVFTTDYAGNQRGSVFDIGAFQYQSPSSTLGGAGSGGGGTFGSWRTQ